MGTEEGTQVGQGVDAAHVGGEAGDLEHPVNQGRDQYLGGAGAFAGEQVQGGVARPAPVGHQRPRSGTRGDCFRSASA